LGLEPLVKKLRSIMISTDMTSQQLPAVMMAFSGKNDHMTLATLVAVMRRPPELELWEQGLPHMRPRSIISKAARITDLWQ